jgi:predicted dehydrogenase
MDRLLSGGIAGFGNAGRGFARFLVTQRSAAVRLVGACDPMPAAQEAARGCGLAATTDLGELLRLKPDFLIIASTSAAHAAQVEEAARAGCHVFCEKPIALNLADADRAIAATEAAGVVTQVNYSLRYIEAYRTLRQWVQQGRFGELLAVTHSRTRGYGLHAAGARHPAVVSSEMSGGWSVHHACHGLDLLYWLGGPLETIYGRTNTTVPGGSEEYVDAVLGFASGATGRISDSVCRIREHYTQIIGSAGSAILTGEREHTKLRFQAENAEQEETVSVRDVKDPGRAFDQFFECIRAGRPSPDSLRDARPSLAAALALQESARMGRVVTLA